MAICDDDSFFCYELEKKIMQLGEREKIKIHTDLFFDGESLWNCLREGTHYDLIFLDIEMEKMDGISVGRAVREQLQDEESAIVYISLMESYAIELFSVRPLDFLIKPITVKKLDRVWKLYCRLSDINQAKFHYKIHGNTNYIALNHILYFRVENRKITIHTEKGREIIFYGKMSEVENALVSYRFLRINRSELVNYHAIQQYQRSEVLLQSGEILPIVSSRRRDIERQMAKYMREEM